MFKRLTKLKGNYVCWNGNQDYSTRDRYAKVLDRLAAYEDTGLTPAQVEAMKMDMEQLRADNINAEMNLAHMTADKDEQAGRLMKLDSGIKQAIKWLTPYPSDGSRAVEKARLYLIALLGGKEDV